MGRYLAPILMVLGVIFLFRFVMVGKILFLLIAAGFALAASNGAIGKWGYALAIAFGLLFAAGAIFGTAFAMLGAAVKLAPLILIAIGAYLVLKKFAN